MGYFFDIRCKKCGYEQPKFRGNGCVYAYLLSDGSILSVPYVPAWCQVCQAVVHAEELPKVESLQRRLRERQAFFVEEPLPQWYIKWREQEIAWRSGRKAAAKCLACGTTEIVRGSIGGGVLHPSCGRRMPFKLSGHFTLANPVLQWLYSSEGDALGRQVELLPNFNKATQQDET